MKIIRETEYKTCDCCGSKQFVRDKAVGCDHCGKEIDTAKRHVDYVGDLTVFYHGKEAEHFMFCCVACALEFARTMAIPKDLDFVSYPLLSGAAKVRAFQQALKKQVTPKRLERAK